MDDRREKLVAQITDQPSKSTVYFCERPSNSVRSTKNEVSTKRRLTMNDTIPLPLRHRVTVLHAVPGHHRVTRNITGNIGNISKTLENGQRGGAANFYLDPKVPMEALGTLLCRMQAAGEVGIEPRAPTRCVALFDDATSRYPHNCYVS